MELTQKGKSRRRLALKQHEYDREIRRLHPAIERLIIFHDLPGTETIFADDQRKRGSIGNALASVGSQ